MLELCVALFHDMALDEFDIESEHRKKRRRREIPPRRVHARLLFDEHLKSDEASISSELADLLGIGMFGN